MVELTIALHYCYHTPEDRLVWDVGHQTYPHKILTGRREQMLGIRQEGGLSGFPKRSESEFDTFGVGHSSTSISAALGMALATANANKQSGQQGHGARKSVAIIGDGAMTAGMAFEALTHAAHTRSDLLVVLNDNNMSISHNVGGLSDYFSKIWVSQFYTNLRDGGKKVLAKLPSSLEELARKTEEHMKGMVSPATLFEELGFYYVGPIDGHDLERLTHDLNNLRAMPGPKLLHIITKKGKGFAPAESDPVGYHALNKIEPRQPPQEQTTSPKPAPRKQPKYQDVFGDWLCDMAQQDEKLIGITPAMCEGSGMVRFAQSFPERFHDVAIAEQHAVTLGAGIACEGQKPVVAIYSTFLQRGYDQLVHDVAIQNLDVTFAIDRAGLVGEDGPTHAGNYDLSFMRCIPNMMICAPSDEDECRKLLTTAYQHCGPSAVRYPRGTGTGTAIEPSLQPLPIGKGVVRRTGKRVAILNFGTLLPAALEAAEALNASVCDMRFVKPLDTDLVLDMYNTHDLLVTLEENAVMGGAGSSVGEWLGQQGMRTELLPLGLPDQLIEHGKHESLLAQVGLDAKGIESRIQQRLQLMAERRPAAS
ncbi:MAG: 1-deoxy-D-xylulose-5-phosphate synthase [Candidatus Pelagadaptatus aseana]